MDDAALDGLCEPMDHAETAILEARATSLTDIERKLSVISGWNGWHEIQPRAIGRMLADVRSLNAGRAP